MRKKGEIEDERNAAIQQRAKVQMEISVLDEMVSTDEEVAKKLKAELHDIEKQIKINTDTLNKKLIPAFKAAEKDADKVRSTLHTQQMRRDQLIEKQARNGNYESVEERNSAISLELTQLAAHMKTSSASLKELTGLIKDNVKAIATHEAQLADIVKEEQQRTEKLLQQAEDIKRLGAITLSFLILF